MSHLAAQVVLEVWSGIPVQNMTPPTALAAVQVALV
jgi:hypothetical protein